jgi:hypothetical protein
MPLKNDVGKDWVGWLVDGLGGREEEYWTTLAEALKARSMPRTSVKTGRVNMWWRKDSRYIDVTSQLDGEITTTIHVQEYGTSLWIGRAAESSKQYNYYKRMASGAFVETVDRCIAETTLTLVDASAIRSVSDMSRD